MASVRSFELNCVTMRTHMTRAVLQLLHVELVSDSDLATVIAEVCSG